MAGKLYLVATPIGNLGDLSPRALETLEGVDFIAAEDTRVSVKLLNHFSIKKPLVSYHQHNQNSAGASVVQRLLAGETCALVTDAGMPAISDPGEDLVRLCAENGVEVLAVPGRIDNPQSRGCHKLLRDGAVLVEQIGDILEAIDQFVYFHSRKRQRQENAGDREGK